MRAILGVALVGLVVCVGCGPPKPTQEEAVAAIKRLGGKVEVDENNDVVNVNLWGTKITDAALVHLKGLPKLTTLNLNFTKITDAGMAHLKGLTKLQFLLLGGTKVTPVGIKQLQQALPECTVLR